MSTHIGSTLVKCTGCGRNLSPMDWYERTGPVNDMKLWCDSCYRREFPTESLPITVDELIEKLQSLPLWAHKLPVYCSYDGFCDTAVYGIDGAKEGDQDRGAFVRLEGD